MSHIENKMIDMTDLSFEEERDLMLEHMGKVIQIPFHLEPQVMSIMINNSLKKKYITISCKNHTKMKDKSIITYDFEFNLKEA